MRSSVSVLAFLALALVVLSHASPRAGEPDGFVRITPVWTAEKDGLILRIVPVVPLAEARLVVSVPDVVTIGEKIRSGSRMRVLSSQPGTRRFVLDMASSLSGLTLELEVAVPPDHAGVGTFLVEGRTLGGRPFSEGIGVALGASDRGVVRDGAIEYPAGTGGGR